MGTVNAFKGSTKTQRGDWKAEGQKKGLKGRGLYNHMRQRAGVNRGLARYEKAGKLRKGGRDIAMKSGLPLRQALQVGKVMITRVSAKMLNRAEKRRTPGMLGPMRRVSKGGRSARGRFN